MMGKFNEFFVQNFSYRLSEGEKNKVFSKFEELVKKYTPLIEDRTGIDLGNFGVYRWDGTEKEIYDGFMERLESKSHSLGYGLDKFLVKYSDRL